MAAWMVVLIVFAVLLALLLCPLVFTVDFADELAVKLRYLFLVFHLLPQKEEKPSKKEKKAGKESPEKENKFQQLLKEKGLSGFLHLLEETAHAAEGLLKRLFSHITVHTLSGDVIVGGSDASETALLYGKACAVVYPAFGVIADRTRCHKYAVSVAPDFRAEESRVLFHAKFSLRPLFALALALSGLKKAMVLLKKWKTKSVKEKGKAV